MRANAPHRDETAMNGAPNFVAWIREHVPGAEARFVAGFECPG